MDQQHPAAAHSYNAFFVCLLLVTAAASVHDGDRHTNVWAVQLEPGMLESEAHQVAADLGFSRSHRIIRQSSGDVYLFEHAGVPKKSVQPDDTHHHRLKRSEKVMWAEQQVAKVRVKRDLHFNDPSLPDAWYLNKGARDGYDLNVKAAWEHGYSGKGAVVSILDDGLEWLHPDLRASYDPDASTDINNSTHDRVDNDPTPRYDYSNENRHGTRCAGEVAAVANNGICSVGVAFGSKIGGVRMLDGDVTDSVEAQSLRFQAQHIDIYSASWGPDDNGRTVDGPGPLAKAAFIDGIEKGRGGKGSIFVWASGNGGMYGDSCACDGYTNSMYTLSVSSTSEGNSRPWYLEECASTVATTYSSGSNSGTQRQIVTTDLNGLCTRRHTGTSASAPLAAAIVALALEANPSLTWRDMQYIVLMTSNPKPLEDGQWVTNGAGRKVSHLYGYGLMDAFAVVKLAANWTRVPERYTRELPKEDRGMSLKGHSQKVTVLVPACQRKTGSGQGLQSSSGSCVRFLEHVQLIVSATYSRRGDLTIILKSPAGTSSTLLPRRPRDEYDGGFASWPFMSVHFWGESPAGAWTVEFVNTGPESNQGYLTSYQLVLHGTAVNPLGSEPADDKCHSECEPPCDNPGADMCALCKHYRLGTDGGCVESCLTKGFFIDEDAKDAGAAAGLCLACSPECETCEGEKATECITCKPGLLLDSAVSRLCVTQCPPATWPDPESAECKPCIANCTACHDESTCTQCAAGFMWHSTKGACIAVCPANQYSDAVDASCKPCHESCSQCTGPSSSDCQECAGTKNLHSGTCLSICPDGFVAYRRTCKKCHESCQTCGAPADNNCHSCRAGLLLTDQNKCTDLSLCGKNHFADTASGACQPCHASCNSCTGSTERNCLTCSRSAVLIEGRCVDSCPIGHFEQSQPTANDSIAFETRRCSPCYAHFCSRCTGGKAADCIECQQPYKLVNPRGCSAPVTCQAKSYLNESGICVSCHQSCAECSGPSEAHCRHCAAGKVLHDGRCIDSCPTGFYDSHPLLSQTPVCLACHDSCKTCSGGAENKCLECNGKMILKNSKCISPLTCYPDQYYDIVTKECQPCDSSCAGCTGPLHSECVTCAAPLHYFHPNHTCVVCCSPEFTSVPCCYCIATTTGMMCNLFLENMEAAGKTDAKHTLLNGGNVSHTDSGLMRLLHPSLTLYIVGICASLFVLYGIIFAVLQARSHRRLCWGNAFGGGMNKVFVPIGSSTDVLYAQVQLDDDDDYDSVYNGEAKLLPPQALFAKDVRRASARRSTKRLPIHSLLMDDFGSKEKFSQPYGSSHMASSKTVRCAVCRVNDARYRCPKCEIRTCSLKCVKLHKENTQCTGKRDRSEYVKMTDFGDRHLLNDYRFLEETSRVVDAAVRNHDKGLPRVRFTSCLIKEAKKRGVKLFTSPFLSSDRKANSSIWIKKDKLIYWHTVWNFAKIGVQQVMKRVSENKVLMEVLQEMVDIDRGSDPVFSHVVSSYRPLDDIRLLMKIERLQCREPIYELLAMDKTLGENLRDKVIVEFPTIVVVNKDELSRYCIR